MEVGALKSAEVPVPSKKPGEFKVLPAKML
jgi:hypothetical protein